MQKVKRSRTYESATSLYKRALREHREYRRENPLDWDDPDSLSEMGLSFRSERRLP